MPPGFFPAKLLLFGEYTVLLGSRALAVPFSRYGGRWKRHQTPAGKGTIELLEGFVRYLAQLHRQKKQLLPLDVKMLSHDIKEGWHFESNVPVGYGLGSSGTLCAAIFDRYRTAEKDYDLPALKAGLAQMESYFHGASSGFDPLVSYLQRSLLILPGNRMEVVPSPLLAHPAGGALFLLDSGISRNTSPFVRLFKKRCKDPVYAEQLQQHLLPLSDACIEALLNGGWPSLKKEFRELSAFQSSHFPDMIPPQIRPLWNQGLESDNYYLKLCGAGGGGMFLGLAESQEEAQKLLKPWKIISCEEQG